MADILRRLGVWALAALLAAGPAFAGDRVPGDTTRPARFMTEVVIIDKDTGLPYDITGGGGGGGGEVTVADGGDVALGALADAACATDNGTCTVNAVLKRVAQRLTTLNTTLSGTLTVGTHAVTQSGTWNIGSITTLPSLPAGTNNIGDVDVLTMPGTFLEDAAHASGDRGYLMLGVRQDTAASLAGTNGDYTAPIFDSSNLLWSRIGAALPAGTNNIGDVDVLTLPVAFNTGASNATTQRVVTASDSPEIAILADIRTAAQDTTPVATNLAAATTGGCTPYGYQSAASTNATSVKASAGTLCSLNVINTTSTLYYLRLYNLASAPTCSSATGFVKTVPVPASTSGAGVALDLGAFGEAYSTGLAFCLTGGGSSTDNTNAATGVYVMASYK